MPRTFGRTVLLGIVGAVVLWVGVGLVIWAATMTVGTQDGPAERFDGWVAHPWLWAGAALIALGLLLDILVVVGGGLLPPGVLAPATAVVLAAMVLAGAAGAWVSHTRTDPTGDLSARARSFPTAASDSGVVVRSSPPPPVAVREWSDPTSQCPAAQRAFSSWADSGTTRSTTGPRAGTAACVLQGERDGWPARLAVVQTGDGWRWTLTVGPPGTL